MKTEVEHADLLKLINRHKGKTLQTLEEINCPEAYLEVIRRRLDYFRNDLISLLIGE
jgi:hypothetical protein